MFPTESHPVFRALLGIALLAAALTPAAPARAGVAPKTLLIYYSYPSSINGTFSVSGAAAELGQYDYVVLGDLLEQTSHPDHANTVAILADPAMAHTTVFGYINLGVTQENLPLSEIELRIDEWQATGAAGIFFDLFGYDYGTTRDRQNAAVDYAHSKGMPVVANAWVPADAFGDEVNAFNPSGTPTSLGASDFYLAESYQIMLDQYVSESDWRTKADALTAFQNSLGFKILSVTTSDVGDTYDPAKFSYTWYSALLDGHEATGWGEYNYSATSASAPFRARPNVDAGTAFTSAVAAASPTYSRATSSGTVQVDATTHAAGFTPFALSGLIPAGRAGTDCTLEWMTEPVPPIAANGLPANKLTCTDDDPTCDFGTAGDAACTFHVALCFNVTDPRLSCTPSDVAQVQIRRPGASQRRATDVTNRAALEAVLTDLGAVVQGVCSNAGPQRGHACRASSDCDGAPGLGNGICRSTAVFAPAFGGTNACTAFAAIRVPLRGTLSRWRTARTGVQIKATPSNDPISGRPRRADSDTLTLVCSPQP